MTVITMSDTNKNSYDNTVSRNLDFLTVVVEEVDFWDMDKIVGANVVVIDLF